MIKVLANDGIDAVGKEMLEKAGFKVDTKTIAQEELKNRLNEYDVVLVRSATKIRKEQIDAAPNLKVILRAGVGMDNIDVEYARQAGKVVMNTPKASSQSVAELVFAHMFTISRFLHDSNRKMPVTGTTDFNKLKKAYAEGVELRGKTLGIIGFGSIGQAVARMALGIGMNVIQYKRTKTEVTIDVDFYNRKDANVSFTLQTGNLNDLLAQSDFITLHLPFKSGSPAILGKEQFDKMKTGVRIVNTARGGAVAEQDLLDALNAGKVAAAALDVFENEPLPLKAILEHPNISLTPHIGASTGEAQERIGVETAEKLIEHFKNILETA